MLFKERYAISLHTRLHEIDIPTNFSTMTNCALHSGNRLEISDCVRDEIVSSLAASILKYTMKPSPQQYTFICTKLVEKYPILEDNYEK